VTRWEVRDQFLLLLWLFDPHGGCIPMKRNKLSISLKLDFTL
jgi:hypothetical protein